MLMTASLRLLNWLTREVETFHPIHAGEARRTSSETDWTAFCRSVAV
jgi:hypothetical protein